MKRERQYIVLRIPKVLLRISVSAIVFLLAMIGLGFLQHFIGKIRGTEMRSGLNLTHDQRQDLELRWQRTRDPAAAARLASYYGAYSWNRGARWRDSLDWIRRGASTGNNLLLFSLVTTLTRSSDPNEVAEGIALLEAMLREKSWPDKRSQAKLESDLSDALERLEATIVDPRPGDL